MLFWGLLKSISHKKIKTPPEYKENKQILSEQCTAASLFEKKASLTVEAALLFPVLIFVFAAFILYFQIMGIQMRLQQSMEEMGGQLAVCGYVSTHPLTEKEGSQVKTEWYQKLYEVTQTAGDMDHYPLFMAAKIMAEMKDLDFVKNQVVGGAAGFLFSAGPMANNQEYVDIILNYQIKIPFLPDQVNTLALRQRVVKHIWNGEMLEATPVKTKEDIVYVTKYGTVYHLYKDCQHLKKDIMQVSISAAQTMKNAEDRNYVACEICIKAHENEQVYLTKGGGCYHNTQNCPSLKRYIEEITLLKTQGKACCTVCEKRRLAEEGEK